MNVNRATLFALWLFVLVVLAYDVYFAFSMRCCFEQWESNPFALWLASNVGIYFAAIFRCATVFFMLVILILFRNSDRIQPHWRWIGSLAAFAIHAYLAGVYVVIHAGG